MKRFPGRVGLQQRVLPDYRLAFIDRLAVACQGGLTVLAGRAGSDEAILSQADLSVAEHVHAETRYPLGGLGLMIQPGLADWIASQSLDALILEANPRYVSNWGGARLAKSAGASVLGWGLGAPAAQHFGPKRWLWARFLRRFDGLIAYSQRGGGEYRLAGVDPSRIHVAPNAATAETVSRPARQAGNGLRVLFVGRLQPRKLVDRLIAACAELTPAPQVRIVGDGPAAGALERMASAMLPSAQFLGALQGKPLHACFAWADVFVLPGTGGLAVQQAMAHGLPVVVGVGDGTIDDLVTPETGWRLPASGQTEALASILRRAASDRERLRQMGEAGRRRIQEGFNLEVMVDRFVDALNAAVRRQ